MPPAGVVDGPTATARKNTEMAQPEMGH